MKKILLLAKAVILTFLIVGSFAQGGQCDEKAYNSGVEIRKILQCTRTVLGQELKYPAAKTPEVTCLEVIIHPGQETGWHTHSVPGYAYVISGELRLEYENGISKTMKAGEAFAEVLDTPHNGKNNGSADVILAAFFTGDKGVPFTKKQDQPAAKK